MRACRSARPPGRRGVARWSHGGGNGAASRRRRRCWRWKPTAAPTPCSTARATVDGHHRHSGIVERDLPAASGHRRPAAGAGTADDDSRATASTTGCCATCAAIPPSRLGGFSGPQLLLNYLGRSRRQRHERTLVGPWSAVRGFAVTRARAGGASRAERRCHRAWQRRSPDSGPQWRSLPGILDDVGYRRAAVTLD